MRVREGLVFSLIGFACALAFQNCAPYEKQLSAGSNSILSEGDATVDEAQPTMLARVFTPDVSQVTDDMVVADVEISGGYPAPGAPTGPKRIQILDDGKVVESRGGIYKRTITYIDTHGLSALRNEARNMTLLPPEDLSNAARCADAPTYSYAVYVNAVRREFKHAEDCVVELKAELPWADTLLGAFMRL